MDNQKLSKEEMLNVTGGISWGSLGNWRRNIYVYIRIF